MIMNAFISSVVEGYRSQKDRKSGCSKIFCLKKIHWLVDCMKGENRCLN